MTPKHPLLLVKITILHGEILFNQQVSTFHPQASLRPSLLTAYTHLHGALHGPVIVHHGNSSLAFSWRYLARKIGL